MNQVKRFIEKQETNVCDCIAYLLVTALKSNNFHLVSKSVGVGISASKSIYIYCVIWAWLQLFGILLILWSL